MQKRERLRENFITIFLPFYECICTSVSWLFRPDFSTCTERDTMPSYSRYNVTFLRKITTIKRVRAQCGCASNSLNLLIIEYLWIWTFGVVRSFFFALVRLQRYVFSCLSVPLHLHVIYHRWTFLLACNWPIVQGMWNYCFEYIWRDKCLTFLPIDFFLLFTSFLRCIFFWFWKRVSQITDTNTLFSLTYFQAPYCC